MLISKCQTNQRRNQIVPHPPKACRYAVVVDIAADAVVVAARARPIKKI